MGSISSGAKTPYILGIDLGTSSLGWACVGLSSQSPASICDLGVRIFEAGVEGNIEMGKDSSRAKVRRDKRLARRQIKRRARRQRKIFRLLQRHGLMPDGPSVKQDQINGILDQLDKTLRAELLTPGDHAAAHVWPYRLRALALKQKLDMFALGRAFYHLAQRRGFLSNRKTDKDDQETGLVKSGITELANLMREAQADTLGEYFASLDPEKVRIRQRWTGRDMYLHEFECIWSAQAEHHSGTLTPSLKRSLHRAMFRQRPLKSAKGFIGRCELEPLRRRTAQAMPQFQRFRLLQAVNNLEIIEPDGTIRRPSREERVKVIDALEHDGDQTFAAIRKMLKLKTAVKRKDKDTGEPTTIPGHAFNLEEGGEKKIPGNRTSSKLRPVFGERWDAMSPRQQREVVQDVLDYEHPAALAERARRRWNLDDEHAAELSKVQLESDYARFSLRALERLLPRMEEGLPYMTARKDEYPASFHAVSAMDMLPSVREAIKDLRNPAVCRALTEARKVVNAVIRRHGKPAYIHIELARDLKQSKSHREKTWKGNRDRQNERESAAHKIKAARLVVGEPNRDAIEKWLLADECNWMCPYTGKTITPELLLGPHSQFDVEHIVPFSISLDNTFLNKTLCDNQFNRHRKINRLPSQCYDLQGQEWHEALLRVRRFGGNAAAVKLERFQWTEVPDGFTNRHLQDTRYTSRLAGEYMGLLYGGLVDDAGKRRIQFSTGGVTAFLRNEWGLNGILNDGGFKSRDDHRHHAVDALTVALVSPDTVKLLSKAAEDAARAGRRRFAQISEPWTGFLNDVNHAVEKIVASHRPDHRVNGPLHNETNYSKPKTVTGQAKAGAAHHERKPLVKLSSNEVDDIVDNRIRGIVKAQLNGGDPKRVFADPKNLPVLPTRSGRAIPIRKARVRKGVTTIRAGRSNTAAYVVPGSNHHIAIIALRDDRDTEVKWEGHIVKRFDAMNRLRKGESVVQREWGPDRRLKFTLSPGDTVEMLDNHMRPQLLRVDSITEKEIEFRSINDARPSVVIRKITKARIRKNPAALQLLRARKVTITPLGEVLACND